VHAAFSFHRDHPDLTASWLCRSNYLVIVSVPDEGALLDLISAASARGIGRTAVREPDLKDEATAVALAPGREAARLCATLPLALKERPMVPL
jgi:hypothetical protein